ncbi:MAG: DUF6036 family nucleotidyltransferase [Clostridiales bacterium]|nr:DUF6036 family nucleotidyltransferase [Clostridiales bacterium]
MCSDNGMYGLSTSDVIFNLKKMDAIMKMEQFKLELCLIGGAACLLTGLISRVTVDYDLLNLNYNPKVRNYLNFFNPYDLVDFEATTIPGSYTERTVTIYEGEYIKCKILSIEDIILSKLCRNLEKDFIDIDVLIKNADIEMVIRLISEVKNDIHTRYPRMQENFAVSLGTFRNRYNVLF